MGTPLSILRLETATISSWPAISSALDGMWLARFARGYTRRANSVQCLDPADDGDAPARLGRMVDLFLLNGREPIFRVTPLAGPGVIAALDAADWSAVDESRVLTMPLTADRPELAAAKVYEGADRNWIEAFADLAGIDRRPRETLAILIGLIAHRQAGLVIRDGAGEPLAAALAVAAGEVGVYHNVVVRKAARGRGLGRAILHAALNWTRAAGATHAAIQVQGDNTPAVGLYTSLGFEEAYRYHYRQPR
jgi:GNAT superfamily N-acetyltransferase